MVSAAGQSGIEQSLNIKSSTVKGNQTFVDGSNDPFFGLRKMAFRGPQPQGLHQAALAGNSQVCQNLSVARCTSQPKIILGSRAQEPKILFRTLEDGKFPRVKLTLRFNITLLWAVYNSPFCYIQELFEYIQTDPTFNHECFMDFS